MRHRSINKLLKEIQSKDPLKRKRAALQLGEKDERAIYPLIKLLSDPHPAVREASINSLIKIGGEVTAFMLLPLLRLNTTLRNSAIHILKNIHNHNAVKLLLQDKDPYMRLIGLNIIKELPEESLNLIENLLNDPSANVRAATTVVLARLNKSSALIDHLDSLLHDAEWVCLFTLKALSIMKIPESTEKIVPLLKNPSGAVRLLAIETLGEIDTTLSKKTLLEHLKNTQDPVEQDFTIRSLIKLGLSKRIPGLKDRVSQLLNKKENLNIAIKAISDARLKSFTKQLLLIAGFFDPGNPHETEIKEHIMQSLLELKPKNELCRLIKEPDLPFVARTLAIELIEKLQIKEAVKYLIPLLRDKSRDIRRAAVKALGKIGPIKGVKEIVNMLNDPDGHVRKEAVIALRNVKRSNVFDSIKSMLTREPYSDVLEEAIKTLMVIDKKRFMSLMPAIDQSTKLFIAQYSDSVNVILELTYDEDNDVKITAITRLGRFRSKKVVSRIKELINDPSPEIRRVAIMSAYRLGCCKKELSTLLEDEDEWVRYYALKVLKNDKTLTEKIKKKLLQDSFPPVVLEAIETLTEQDVKNLKDELSVLSKHEDSDIREKVKKLVEEDDTLRA